jgi:hypothetical protein
MPPRIVVEIVQDLPLSIDLCLQISEHLEFVYDGSNGWESRIPLEEDVRIYDTGIKHILLTLRPTDSGVLPAGA